jgi:hypothetical protein
MPNLIEIRSAALGVKRADGKTERTRRKKIPFILIIVIIINHFNNNLWCVTRVLFFIVGAWETRLQK